MVILFQNLPPKSIYIDLSPLRSESLLCIDIPVYIFGISTYLDLKFFCLISFFVPKNLIFQDFGQNFYTDFVLLYTFSTFLCFYNGFPMVIVQFPMVSCVFSYGFAKVSLWFSCSFPMVFHVFAIFAQRSIFPLTYTAGQLFVYYSCYYSCTIRVWPNTNRRILPTIHPTLRRAAASGGAGVGAGVVGTGDTITLPII